MQRLIFKNIKNKSKCKFKIKKWNSKKIKTLKRTSVILKNYPYNQQVFKALMMILITNNLFQ